ncbi:hypothetical protein NG798_27500 [Ancylothrix sp. C2]|uniref:hypothetical protein n=1 Tax=Ancylothrix sp. D3o TaxID=2953691 RepID=UPI0021BB2A9D|nr:hypothetical protein [Ancylothrix sp. D3o]MCT7953547.1 hypothetical protein [Ancylothrix sp. D3o]
MMVLVWGATEFSVKTLAKIMFYTGTGTNKSPGRWMTLPDSTIQQRRRPAKNIYYL